jgi:hypothetical protein
MTQLGRTFCTLTAALILASQAGVGLAQQGGTNASRSQGAGKPSLSFKATPPVGFSPLRVRIVVDVRGGADDYAEFYCPSIEWDWGDGTISESSEDCDPYEAGKSTIKRRFSNEHVFRSSGTYQVYFRLKQKDKTISASNGNIQVRAGARDEQFER